MSRRHLCHYISIQHLHGSVALAYQLGRITGFIPPWLAQGTRQVPLKAVEVVWSMGCLPGGFHKGPQMCRFLIYKFWFLFKSVIMFIGRGFRKSHLQKCFVLTTTTQPPQILAKQCQIRYTFKNVRWLRHLGYRFPMSSPLSITAQSTVCLLINKS